VIPTPPGITGKKKKRKKEKNPNHTFMLGKVSGSRLYQTPGAPPLGSTLSRPYTSVTSPKPL
jgi:hypothetical protein